MIAVVIGIFGFSILRSCSEQSMTRSWGGTMEITLEPNQKLMEVTWKEDSLWFLTKKMTEDDVEESYEFYEKDVTGWLEGCVYIHEIKLSEEELEEYENQRQYAEDYYSYSNYDAYSHPIFIEYDVTTDRYILLKPYSYGPDGELVPAN